MFIIICLGCQNHKHTHHQHELPTDNYGMVNYLDSMYKMSDPSLSYNLNRKKAEMYKLKYEKEQDPTKKGLLMVYYAGELLNGGKTQEAIEIYEFLRSEFKNNNKTFSDENRIVLDNLAIAYLRLGEQENCINNHTSSSCIIPLQAEGYHRKKEGSEKAIAVYEQILELFPNDYSSMWLLNIAYMTLGKYPSGVPKQYYIPMPKYSKDSKLPYFEDFATNLGIDVLGTSGSAIMDDFNNDGMLDIFCTAYGLHENCALFIQTQNGFEDRTESAGLHGITSGLNCIHADYNNDGFLDILILRGGWLNEGGKISNSLLHNNGDGTFTDVTRFAGLFSERPTQTAVWLDYDLDGWLDLYIANETPPGGSNIVFPNEMYHNNQDGTFTNQAEIQGLDIKAFCKGVNSGDFNNDGYPDIYISILGDNNLLFLNGGKSKNGSWTWKEISKSSNVQEPKFSFPNIVFDYDNDGNQDIMVFGYSSNLLLNLSADAALEYLNKPTSGELPILYKNLGNANFKNVSKEQGLNAPIYAMGCATLDLDNDGFQSVYAGTGAPDLRTIVPNKLLYNNSGRGFLDETRAGFGHIQKGHGIATGDLDFDGDIDVYCVQGGAFEGDVAYNVLYVNPKTPMKDYIELKLIGTTTNKSGIGSKIRINYVDKANTTRHIYRWVGAGGTFGSSCLLQQIGLNDCKELLSVEISWANNLQLKETFTGIELGNSYVITEGDSKIKLNERIKTNLENMKSIQTHSHHH